MNTLALVLWSIWLQAPCQLLIILQAKNGEDGQQTGFLLEEYADAILKVSRMPETDRLKMAAAARKRAARFSEQRFFEDFKAAIRPMLNHVSR
ncbi:hypothetical protein D5086_028487 [Populus alba]|uniref:Uncharacterized protein n=1 Tax=Populus alba TaxID=43335 RepID=A0ACC4AYB6_POPAL